MHEEVGPKRPFVNEVSAEEARKFDEALKRARGLYYKNMIFEQSRGKSGEQVTRDSLSEEDRQELRYLWTQDDGRVPADIKKFIDTLMEK